MAPITGREAEELAERLEEQHAKERADALSRRKAEAATTGKEPFDLEKLERLCDTSSEGRLAPLDERRAQLEYMYYVNNPSIMTIEELAAYIARTNKW